MRQHHGVQLGMRQAEAAAEGVAELVMQADRDAAHDRAAHPGADQRVAARGEVARVALQARQGGGALADAFLGEQVDHRIAVGRVQALGGMGDGVDRADDADGERQAERQLGVVDHGARQHRRIAAGALGAALGEAVHRRHLAAGVGGRDRDHRHARVERERLGEAGGRAAADGDEAVGVDAAAPRPRPRSPSRPARASPLRRTCPRHAGRAGRRRARRAPSGPGVESTSARSAPISSTSCRTCRSEPAPKTTRGIRICSTKSCIAVASAFGEAGLLRPEVAKRHHLARP